VVHFILSYEDVLVEVYNLKALIYPHIVNAKIWRLDENHRANEVQERKQSHCSKAFRIHYISLTFYDALLDTEERRLKLSVPWIT